MAVEDDRDPGGDRGDAEAAGEDRRARPLSDRGGLIGTIVSHYRILERLGRGGMGVVYKAYDDRLDRTVALKFLPTILDDETPALERFIGEARAASALDHPNICTIYEIGGLQSGEIYIAMACYEGETLKQKIARGGLDVDAAVDYTIQIASGLSKAHAAGIVHRDMKPANVIITHDGVAKILDFGLAKVEDQGLTRTGELLGTLDYMSPEQMQGEEAGAASDVWSLGAMLYEMLSGRRPFRGANQAAILYAVLNEEPAPIEEVNPEVSVEIAEIVHGCLEKSPDRRFANAGEVLGSLDRASGSVRTLPTAGRTRGIPAGRARGIPAGGRATPPARSAAAAAARKRNRNLKMSIAYILPLAALLSLVALPGPRSAISSLLSPRTAEAHPFVAVIPTTASNADDNATAEGLTHTLTGALARLGHGPDSLRVVPSSEILNQDVGTALRAHELFGVNRVVSVAVVRAGVAGIQLVLQDPNRPELGQLASVDLPMPDHAAFFDQLAGALVELLGLASDSRLAEVVAEQRPASPTAFNFTVLGRGKLQQGYNIPSQLDAAIQLFENALGEDPDYAPALAGLCEALFEKGRRTNDPTFRREGLDQCALARESGADQVAVLVPLAAVYLQTGEVGRAEDAVQAAIAIDSTSADAYRWLARVHEQNLEDEAAREAYVRAIELEPGMWVYHNEYGTFLALRDLHGEALQHFDQVRMLAPDNYLGDLGRSYSLIQLGRLSQARGVLERLVREHGVDRAYSNLGYLHLREGRYDDAIAVLEEGLSRYERDWWMHRWLAHAAHWAGDAARARRAWTRIVELASESLEFNRSDQDLLIGLAEAHARLGDRGAAREFLGDAEREPIRWSYNVYYLGRVNEMLDDRDAALARIREAVERGYDLDTIEDDPWLEELRADPGFADVRALARAP